MASTAKLNSLPAEIYLLPAKEDDFLNILTQLEQLFSLAFKNAVHDAFNLCHNRHRLQSLAYAVVAVVFLSWLLVLVLAPAASLYGAFSWACHRRLSDTSRHCESPGGCGTLLTWQTKTFSPR